jgi:hypothetical protein
MAGELDALVESFAGEPELHHPVRGRIRGTRAFEAFVTETRVARAALKPPPTVCRRCRPSRSRQVISKTRVRPGGRGCRFGYRAAMSVRITASVSPRPFCPAEALRTVQQPWPGTVFPGARQEIWIFGPRPARIVNR